jgi:RimJ/RimL family protein N-acetyltransferase
MAGKDDERLLLRWANDPAVREYAANSAAITAEDHKVWFKRRLSDSQNCGIYIAESDFALPLGQVRFEGGQGQTWTIDYSLDHFVRGRGFSRKMLYEAMCLFNERQGGEQSFKAVVKIKNAISIRVFDSLGFTRDQVNTEYLKFSYHFQ